MVEQQVPLRLSVPSFATQRRVSVRYASSVDVTCRIDHREHFDCRWARVCNISVSGVGLLISACIEPGTGLTIQMSNLPIQYGSGLRARVAHATQQDDGNWLVGCVFEEPLDEDELHELFV